MSNSAARVQKKGPTTLHEPAEAVREVMDIRQAAEYLGISADSLYRYASESTVPAFRLGNRWRFKKSRLDAWMDEQSNSVPVLAVKSKQKKPVTSVQ